MVNYDCNYLRDLGIFKDQFPVNLPLDLPNTATTKSFRHACLRPLSDSNTAKTTLSTDSSHPSSQTTLSDQILSKLTMTRNRPSLSTNPDQAPGHLGNLTLEQQSKLDKLRKEVQDAGYVDRTDDSTLLRFLRARKFDLNKALQMFIDCEKWRVEFGVEQIKRTFRFDEREKVNQYYPQYFHKTDKFGRPLYIEQLDTIDIPAMYKVTTQKRLLQNLVVEYEKFEDIKLPACCRKEGRLVETCFTILDLKNVTLKQVASVYGYIQEASKIGQNYYPDRMGRFYMINSPRGFFTVWQVIKRFLDPVTVEKISILGKDYQPALLAAIPAENLPKRFGGTCECPEGCELSDAGPWQEIEYTTPLTPQTCTTKAESEESIIQQEGMGMEGLAIPRVGM